MSAIWLDKVRTAVRLGPANILRYLAYVIPMRLGVHPVQRLPDHAGETGPFFRQTDWRPIEARPRLSWLDRFEMFGEAIDVPLSDPPDFLANPQTGVRALNVDDPWWRAQLPDEGVGEFKNIWDLSRMDWALVFAQRARNGDSGSLDRLNRWLSHWCAQNPPYRGPNWGCGQEAGLRVLHLAAAATILDQEGSSEPALLAVVKRHLERIRPSTGYAIAQDNNHGISEAAAMWVGGTWLSLNGDRDGERFARIGAHWLNDRIRRLIMAGGTFSLYSVNYHRCILDIVSFVEIWRRRLDLRPLDDICLARIRSALGWLGALVSPRDGDAPNFGANDGSRLFAVTDTEFRNYLPTVALASALFENRRVLPDAAVENDALRWFGIAMPQTPSEELPTAWLCVEGGIAILRSGGALLLARAANLRFRPSQSDILHVDLTIPRGNILRDGGSYSYFATEHWQAYFSGPPSHNVVQMDGRDQMRKVSRFLHIGWPRSKTPFTHVARDGHHRLSMTFRDQMGASHRRDLAFGEGALLIEDRIDGFQRQAVLRWRLPDGPVAFENGLATGEGFRIAIETDGPAHRMELVEGWESRLYGRKTPVRVLEIELDRPGTIRTTINWH